MSKNDKSNNDDTKTIKVMAIIVVVCMVIGSIFGFTGIGIGVGCIISWFYAGARVKLDGSSSFMTGDAKGLDGGSGGSGGGDGGGCGGGGDGG